MLEKILQEIEEKFFCIPGDDYSEVCVVSLDDVREIMRSHMEDDGWIPIEDGPPPIGRPLMVTIKDNLQGKPNELRYPVYYEKDGMKNGYHWSWRYGDFAYELLPEVSEIIAWQPVPEPYRPKED